MNQLSLNGRVDKLIEDFRRTGGGTDWRRLRTWLLVTLEQAAQDAAAERDKRWQRAVGHNLEAAEKLAKP